MAKKDEQDKETFNIYIGQHKIQDYHGQQGEENVVLVQRTFMSRWTDTFKYFQVFFLIAVIVSLLVFSGMLFADKLYMDYDELYQKSVLEQIDDFDELNPAPTR